jgi:hypothetical protein
LEAALRYCRFGILDGGSSESYFFHTNRIGGAKRNEYARYAERARRH